MITLDKAVKAIEVAIKKAESMGEKVTVCVVDNYGVLIAAQKMDGALVVSPKFAQAKAYTAGVIQLATADIAKYSVPGMPFYGTTSAFEGEMMVIAGGIPVKGDKGVVGAVGVGGSHDVNKDVEIAKVAVDALEK